VRAGSFSDKASWTVNLRYLRVMLIEQCVGGDRAS